VRAALPGMAEMSWNADIQESEIYDYFSAFAECPVLMIDPAKADVFLRYSA
jgi:hypothetical protein